MNVLACLEQGYVSKSYDLQVKVSGGIISSIYLLSKLD